MCSSDLHVRRAKRRMDSCCTRLHRSFFILALENEEEVRDRVSNFLFHFLTFLFLFQYSLDLSSRKPIFCIRFRDSKGLFLRFHAGIIFYGSLFQEVIGQRRGFGKRNILAHGFNEDNKIQDLQFQDLFRGIHVFIRE